MARGAGSTFDTVLPLAKKHNVAAINWGFVAGKTQTYYPWDSWRHPYILDQPTVWFHEVLHEDGKPYRDAEVKLIRELTGRGTSTTKGALKPSVHVSRPVCRSPFRTQVRGLWAAPGKRLLVPLLLRSSGARPFGGRK